MKKKNSEVNTIRGTSIRTQQDGWPMSETAIRRLIAADQIPHFKIGNRTYIPYNRFCDYIGVVRQTNTTNPS